MRQEVQSIFGAVAGVYLHGHAVPVRELKLSFEEVLLPGLIGIGIVIVQPYFAKSYALGVGKQPLYAAEVVIGAV